MLKVFLKTASFSIQSVSRSRADGKRVEKAAEKEVGGELVSLLKYNGVIRTNGEKSVRERREEASALRGKFS